VRYAFAIALLGCGAESGAGLGDACSLAIPCGTGGVCDYTIPKPVCIDAAADPDGDGIPNAMDHCPNAPGGLYDEDGDGIGDDCDPCPIAKPPAVPDADGDAVDSPCDPDPRTPGDTILFFDGFNGAPSPKWMPDPSGAWTVEGGELVVRLGSIPDESYFKVIVSPEPNLAVEASYRVDKVETSATTHIVAVAARDSRPAGVASFECGVVRNDVGGNDDVVDLETNQGATSHGVMGQAFSSASLYRAAAYATGINVGCTVIGDNMPLGTTQGMMTPDALGTVSLGARAVTARFQWVMVVGRN
jgi:hypothetical protein